MNNLEVNDKPSARTIVLLYAADLFFRLRWEIIPALEEGKSVVAVPYVETGIAFGKLAGVPAKWLDEVFRFAPQATESFRVDARSQHKLGASTSGFVEFCSSVQRQDLRPQFAAYFEDLDHCKKLIL